MTNQERTKILEMVAEGSLTVEQADQLLERLIAQSQVSAEKQPDQSKNASEFPTFTNEQLAALAAYTVFRSGCADPYLQHSMLILQMGSAFAWKRVPQCPCFGASFQVIYRSQNDKIWALGPVLWRALALLLNSSSRNSPRREARVMA